MTAASWLLTGFAAVPLGCTLGLGLAALVLTALLGALEAPAWFAGRPTGLGAMLHELWSLPLGVLPGFCRAIGRVRRPVMWGVLAGVVLGAGWHLLRGAVAR